MGRSLGEREEDLRKGKDKRFKDNNERFNAEGTEKRRARRVLDDGSGEDVGTEEIILGFAAADECSAGT